MAYGVDQWGSAALESQKFWDIPPLLMNRTEHYMAIWLQCNQATCSLFDDYGIFSSNPSRPLIHCLMLPNMPTQHD